MKHKKQPVTVSVISREPTDTSWSCLIAVKRNLGKKYLFFFFFFLRWNDKTECLRSSFSWAACFFQIFFFSLKISIRQWNCLLNLNSFNIFVGKKKCNVYFIRTTKQSTLNKGCLFKIRPTHLCHSLCTLKCSPDSLLSNVFH